MKINKIALKSFRKFSNYNLQLNDKINIIYGKNAIGKTTILESIYFLSVTKSPRTSETADLIPENNNYLACEGSFSTNNGIKNVFISFSDGVKKVIVNKSKIRRLSDYVGTINAIYYQPNEIVSFLSTPQFRRNGINSIFCQISRKYLECLKLYNSALKQRKFALKGARIKKNKENYILIEMIDSNLIKYGNALMGLRSKFVELINSKLYLIHEQINASENLTLEYKPNIKYNKFEDALKLNLEKDISTETTSCGPHKDDFIFKINNQEITKYCSQGQQKSSLLSFKICMTEIFYDIKKDYPILLLDDAFSELDQNRQNALFKLINQNIQVLISTTTLKDINSDILKNANIIEIEKGEDGNE